MPMFNGDKTVIKLLCYEHLQGISQKKWSVNSVAHVIN